MTLWFKKLLVATIAVITLGTYVPTFDLEATELNKRDVEQEKNQPSDHAQSEIDSHHETETILSPIEDIKAQASHYTLEKLGNRVMKTIEKEMTEEILPNLEAVLESLVNKHDYYQLYNLSLVPNQSRGYGEKIFDLYDETTNEIVAKFHIRREIRPLEGHWFNFHYHLKEDQYNHHYSIGDVHYGKNTPPKWMS